MAYFNLNTGHSLNPRSDDVRDLKAIMSLVGHKRDTVVLDDVEFASGLNVVFGPTGIGKSVLLQAISQFAAPSSEVIYATLDESTPDGSSFTSLTEIAIAIRSQYSVSTTQAELDNLDMDIAEDLALNDPLLAAHLVTIRSEFTGSLTDSLNDLPALFPAFTRSIMPTPTRSFDAPLVLIIDSFRLLQFNSGGSIRAGGVDNGFFSTLTDLDNICRAFGVVMFAAFNPMSTADAKRQELLDLVEASVTGLIEVESPSDFTLRSRNDGRIPRKHSIDISGVNKVASQPTVSATQRVIFAAIQSTQTTLPHNAMNVLKGITP